ncbi:MAG: maleylpyruvate isomerase [Pseudonocardiales bacterium]|jgi:maleylpyruvate isomerase|nr:maleylpyruvate isomerase [Pseudonocardiales bacterium]
MNWLSTDETWPWLRTGTDLFLGAVDGVTDAEFDEPTALPHWCRRHLVAHMGLNAQALQRLVRWAATGEATPMYSSTEQRSGDIDAGSAWSPQRLRDFVHETAVALEADLDGLPADRWTAEVRTAQGRAVPATEIVWMRVREVAVHSVDLGVGIGFGDLRAALCAALIGDVAARRSTQGDGPAVELVSSDGGTWRIDGVGAAATVRGSVVDLASWLTGRGSGALSADKGGLPELGPWL